MTLRLSPVQLDIINFLKIPGNTPEDYAKMKFLKVTTVNVQLHRVRMKDREARVYRATLNGLIGRNPWLRQWLKTPYDGQPEPGLTPKDKEMVDRRLQNPNDLRSSVERRGQKGRRKNPAITSKKHTNKAKRRNVK